MLSFYIEKTSRVKCHLWAVLWTRTVNVCLYWWSWGEDGLELPRCSFALGLASDNLWSRNSVPRCLLLIGAKHTCSHSSFHYQAMSGCSNSQWLGSTAVFSCIWTTVKKKIPKKSPKQGEISGCILLLVGRILKALGEEVWVRKRDDLPEAILLPSNTNLHPNHLPRLGLSMSWVVFWGFDVRSGDESIGTAGVLSVCLSVRLSIQAVSTMM